MIINFTQNSNYFLDVRECLEASDLWLSLEIIDHALWIDDDYVSITHKHNILQLGCSIPIHSHVSIDQLHNACNDFNKENSSKTYYESGTIRIQVDLFTKGGVACRSLLAATESFYLDMLKIEERLQMLEFFEENI
jgi:hypothetical protein